MSAALDMLHLDVAKSDKPQPIADFTRMKIREWEESGRELKELAHIAALAKSHPSQVKGGVLGVGPRAIPGYAKAFGMSPGDYVAAAYEWFATHGRQVAETVEHDDLPARKAALEVVRGMGQATEAQLRTIVGMYSAPGFRDRDTEWWLLTLLTELRRDRERDFDRKAEDRAAKDYHERMQARRAEKRAADEPSRAKPLKRRKVG
jgi:hypothetical protein